MDIVSCANFSGLLPSTTELMLLQMNTYELKAPIDVPD